VIAVAISEQLEALFAPAVQALGCELWGIEYKTRAQDGALLRVYIDKPDGILLEDCEKVSRQISSLLDVEDPISGEYTLEVSSPGMDRPLYKLAHYAQSQGEIAFIKLRVAFEGRRNFKGLLKGVEADEVVLEIDGEDYLLPYELIDKANIIPRF
jgi:ribosome maturation factor RimP